MGCPYSKHLVTIECSPHHILSLTLSLDRAPRELETSSWAKTSALPFIHSASPNTCQRVMQHITMATGYAFWLCNQTFWQRALKSSLWAAAYEFSSCCNSALSFWSCKWLHKRIVITIRTFIRALSDRTWIELLIVYHQSCEIRSTF